MASHPLVGTWLAGRAPNDIAVAHSGPDGSYDHQPPTVGVGADGTITHNDSSMGSWVPISASRHPLHLHEPDLRRHRRAHRLLHRRGLPVASEDGMSFWDDGAEATVTIRDPNGVVTQSFGGDRYPAASAACGWCPASPATTRCSPCSRRRPRPHRPRSDHPNHILRRAGILIPARRLVPFSSLRKILFI